MSNVKSGVSNKVLESSTLGGCPAKKSVDQIEKVNRPGSAPKSAGV